MEYQHVSTDEPDQERRQQAIYGVPERDFLAWKAARRRAAARGIEFRFTLLGWRLWWAAARRQIGPEVRRKREARVMARYGDAGPYEPGNVYAVMPGQEAVEAVPTISVRRCHLAVRGQGHPRSRAVVTPDANYASATLAAEAHGITRQGAAQRARSGWRGWRYA